MQQSKPPNMPIQTGSRTAKWTIILIGFCAAVAILGIFVGVIVIYGGMQSL